MDVSEIIVQLERDAERADEQEANAKRVARLKTQREWDSLYDTLISGSGAVGAGGE